VDSWVYHEPRNLAVWGVSVGLWWEGVGAIGSYKLQILNAGNGKERLEVHLNRDL